MNTYNFSAQEHLNIRTEVDNATFHPFPAGVTPGKHSWHTMPGKKQSPAAVPAITPPTEITAPPAPAGPPEPTNPDKPWGLKDTFRWLVHLLRSHNTLFDSHIELQRTVNDLRQNILELARLPITAPIWCDSAIDTIVQPSEAAPEEPLFPLEPPQKHSPEQIQPDQPEDTYPDKGPMDSQLWTDENIRHGLEQAQLQEAIRQSKQPQFPPVSPTSQHPTAASATVGSPSKQALNDQQNTPPDNRASKPNRSHKATQRTPVKALPPNRPTQISKTSKQQHKQTPPATHPPPKRRRAKTTQAELNNQHTLEDYLTEEAELPVEENSFDQLAEEESPKHTSPEFEGPVEPVPAPKKKSRKKGDK